MIIPRIILIDDYLALQDMNGNQLEEEQMLWVKNKIENVLKEKNGYLQKEGYVYFLSDINGLTKIGCTSNIKARKSNLKSLFGELKLIKLIKSDSMIDLERYYHVIFKGNRIKGEWFKIPEKQIIDLKIGIFEKENFSAEELEID